MQIECPACHARATLPEAKAGAKVRCGQCGRVYVAQRPGTRRESKTDTLTGKLLGGTVAAVGLIALVFVVRSQKDEAVAQKPSSKNEEVASEEPIDALGWNSDTIQTVVEIHAKATADDLDGVAGLLFGTQIAVREDGEAAGESFALLPATDREARLTEWAEGLLDSEEVPVAGWTPYDGEVVELTDETATVRLAVSPADPADGVEKRWVEWQLARDGARWKAWAWERWYTPEERRARTPRKRDYEKVTLSDGSVVHEREPEPLEHLATTPAELRERIDELYATMIDLNLTTEASRAQAELVQIGKPAIPVLLTGLYETPLDTHEQSIQVNLIDQTLRQITGQFMGYKPQVQEGSGTGTTEERRQSSIRQWFAWWYRNESKFQEKEVEDELDRLLQEEEG